MGTATRGRGPVKAGPPVLFYGDNLDRLRKLDTESVDLCYMDPPFNSDRTYNQIYGRNGEDRAQAQAFIDTWEWNDRARLAHREIIGNDEGRFTPQLVDVIRGLHKVIGEGSLFAYLVGMAIRVTEIHRVLKQTGSYYLHCDPTASHYLKVVLDAIFGAENFRNEIVWLRSKNPKGSQHGLTRFSPFTDTLFFYARSEATSLDLDRIRTPLDAARLAEKYPYSDEHGPYQDGPILRSRSMGPRPNLVYEYKGFTPGPAGWRVKRELLEEIDRRGDLNWTETGVRRKLRPEKEKGDPVGSFWGDIPPVNSQAAERLGYPTQKPVALLERIILASTKEGDVVLDPCCGCGTTIAAAQKHNRQWIGIDITFQSISLVLQRLEDQVGEANWPALRDTITITGIPKDMASAKALAHQDDDRVRKEFEKWAVLTYTNNRARINEKKGADGGIDGRVYFITGAAESAMMVLQAKSGIVSRGDIAKLRGDMQREGAALATLITLVPPTGPMIDEAKTDGLYHHTLMDLDYDKIQIVTVQEIIEDGRRLKIPLLKETTKPRTTKRTGEQLQLGMEAKEPDGAAEVADMGEYLGRGTPAKAIGPKSAATAKAPRKTRTRDE